MLRQRRRVSFGWWLVTVLTSLVLLGMGGEFVQAQPITHGFHSITPGISQQDKQTGERQLWIDVLKHDIEDGVAYFTFYNVGTQACSITDIYIDDGQLCTLLYIINGEGVAFSIGATPGNLPGGQYAEPPFVATKQFNMDSDPPVNPWGINPGEQLEAIYSIEPGKTQYDIDAEIDAGILRIGYHVQAFGDGKSASFVNNTEGIPEPSTVLLLGLGALALIKKFKNKQKNC